VVHAEERDLGVVGGDLEPAHEGREIVLGSGVFFMGRSSSCHIIVDDGLASRRHAKLEVSNDGVSVEDCGSVNGVYVNSRRIAGLLWLKDGDHVQIGRQDFVLRSMLVSDTPERERERDRERDRSLAATRIDDSRELPQMVSENEATFSGDTLDLLGGVAEKILALGRGEEAERILSAPLVGLLGELKAGRRAQSGSDIIEKAGRYAVKLAEATNKGRWVDYVIDLYAVARRPMPAIGSADRSGMAVWGPSGSRSSPSPPASDGSGVAGSSFRGRPLRLGIPGTVAARS
jgi:hypothetical protein